MSRPNPAFDPGESEGCRLKRRAFHGRPGPALPGRGTRHIARVRTLIRTVVALGLLTTTGIVHGCEQDAYAAPPAVDPGLPPSAAQPQPDPVNGSTLADIYDSVSPSVVNIAVSAQSRDVFGRPVTQEGTGSGFIIDPQGHVVTNDHVVTGADRVDVILWDGSSYVGQVIGSDPANDLAVLRIQAPPERLTQLTVAPLGDFSSVRVGQFVVAIGNPFGLERSASLGIVSSLGRTRPGLEERLITNMIQTDAAINPGNSGGPLLNLRGEVVGINAQMGVSGRSNVGIGFAIPVSTLTRYLPELLAGRAPRHAWLGVAGNSLTPTLAERLQIPVQQGVLVTRTTAGGPAARAGFRTATRADPSSGDIIVQIDGRPVRSVEDVAVIIDQRDPGDTVRVAYLREGKMETVDVTLGVWEEREAEP